MAIHLSVRADPETGEWLTEPKYEGEVDLDEFSAQPDTDETQYDTFTGALTTHWIKT